MGDLLECDGDPILGNGGGECCPCRYAGETTGGLHEPSGEYEILFECLAERAEDCPFYEKEEDDG